MNRVAKWLANLSESDNGLLLIGVASFLETIIVPIPIELVLIPYMLTNRDKIWRIAAVTTVGCLIGAIVGYGIGFFLFDTVGHWLIQTLDYQQAYKRFRHEFEAHGFWAILIIGIAPIPFQVAMITAGVAGYPLLLFLIASGIARGIRYFGLALLVVIFGARALTLWKSHSTVVGIGILLVILAIILASILF